MSAAAKFDGVGERRTARLLLRRPAAADLPWLAAMHSDPLNYPHSPDPPHSRERARSLAEMTLGDWKRDGIGYWLVEHDGRPIGMAGIKPSPLAGRQSWNLYYRFLPAARGQGFAAEATREALVVAALLAPARPVVVRTRPGNHAARRLAETIGLARRPEFDTDDGFVVYVTAGW
jgi:RimJ/RimL family protein N-acetyltransferase